MLAFYIFSEKREAYFFGVNPVSILNVVMK